jgi:hypothetical protein
MIPLSYGFVAAYPSWPMISIMNHGISLKRSIKQIPTHQNVLDRTLLMNAGYSGFLNAREPVAFASSRYVLYVESTIAFFFFLIFIIHLEDTVLI